MARPLAWGETLLNQPLVNAAAPVNVNLLTGVADSDTITVARLVGHLSYTTDNVENAVDGAMIVDIGIQVVTAQALAAGGAAVPNPGIADETPARGWLYHDRVVIINAITAGSLDWHTLPENRFDLRAMRKVDRGVLILSMRTTVIHGTSYNTKVVGIVRALCMT